MRIGPILAAVLALALFPLPAGSAQTDWDVQQTLELESEPLDIVTAPRSRRVYVLNRKGEILVYAFDGKRKGKVEVGDDVFRIKAGPSDGTLFLLRKKSTAMQTITIDLTENIDIKGSPVKGPQSAAVTIAVFSDFQ